LQNTFPCTVHKHFEFQTRLNETDESRMPKHQVGQNKNNTSFDTNISTI